MFAAAICVTLNESLNDIKNSFYRGQQYLCFSKITLVEVKSFPLNTKNTQGNYVNKQKTYKHHTQRERWH